MNIFKSIIISAFLVCFSSFGMESTVFHSQTVEDLRKIAHHYGMNAHEKDPAMEVVGICREVKTRNQKGGEALELGLDLLQTAISLETMAKEQGYTLWWRYSNGIDGDIATGKKKSFGRTLLAGFINDGVKHFRGGMFGFHTACSYIYWANTRYFECYFLEEQLKYLRDLQEFIAKNEYSVNVSGLTEIKEFCENKKLDLTTHDKVISFLSNKKNQRYENVFNETINNLIIKIQYDSKYNKVTQEEEITNLHNRKSALFSMDFSVIKEALLGDLFVLPLKFSEEQRLLRERYNLFVDDLDRSVFGCGEDFHPRLSSQQLGQIKERLIPIYSKGQLADASQLKEQLLRVIANK